jgi:hypothetical protein
MKKTYEGGCHCGRVRYQVDVDLEAGTGRCNCSICAKKRFWGAQVKPADFRLLTAPQDVGDYQFTAGSTVHHRFCKHCGIHAFGDGHVEQTGGAFVSVNIACLDGVTPEELAALPVRYMDGLHNNWWNEPAVKTYL